MENYEADPVRIRIRDDRRESMNILELMKERRIYFDGGMGSLLQARGLQPGELPETWNLSKSEIIEEIHREYLEAGSDVVTTNTFGANHFKFKAEDGYSVQEIVLAAVGKRSARSKPRTRIRGARHGTDRKALKAVRRSRV